MHISSINQVTNKKYNSAVKNNNKTNVHYATPIAQDISFEGGSLSAKILKLAEKKPLPLQRKILNFFGKHEELLKTYTKEEELGVALNTAFDFKIKQVKINKENYSISIPKDSFSSQMQEILEKKCKYLESKFNRNRNHELFSTQWLIEQNKEYRMGYSFKGDNIQIQKGWNLHSL